MRKKIMAPFFYIFIELARNKKQNYVDVPCGWIDFFILNQQ